MAAEIAGALLKRDMPLSRYRVRSLRPLAPCDVSEAREKLGWQPEVGAVRGMAETFGG
jgi:nucleoside-diphosphate-sugar epimerase